MNDQSQMMNQHQVRKNKFYDEFSMNYNLMMNRSKMVKSYSSQMAQMVNQPPQAPPQMVNQMVSQGGQLMGQGYGQWPPQQPPPQPYSMAPPPPVMNSMSGLKFPNPMTMSNPPPMYGGAVISKPGRGSGGGNNWKGKKHLRRKDNNKNPNLSNNLNNMNMNMNMSMNPNVSGGVYQPPTLYELEQQNRLRARRFYNPKRKFNRMGPYAHAPRNTTSYIIRAKKSGGIASLVSPCPVTPAVLPTPVFSPSKEALVDMAKEEWGVDGYGSMKGLIRLRSPGHDETVDDYDEEEDGGSSESDVEEHVEVERRLDHDLSRFEMIYPNSGLDYHNVLENRVDDQDTHIAQLEEENLILKERLYLMEREVGEMRRRLVCLERQNQVVEDINEEVVENVSENDSEGLRSIPLLANKGNEEVDYVPGLGAGENRDRREHSDESLHKELKELAVKDVFHGEAMESNEHGEINKCENGLVDDRHAFEGLDDKLAGEVNEKPSDQYQSVESKDLSSADGVRADRADEVVKDELVGDDCMGVLPDEVNENDRSDKGTNTGTGAILMKGKDTEASGAQGESRSNLMENEEFGDVCMGDALATHK